MRALLDVLFPPRESERVVRSLSVAELGRRFSPTALEACPGTTALFPYRDPIIECLILEAKFNGNRKAQALLGSCIYDFLSDWHADNLLFEERPVVLVPIPLSRTRERERGYNQVEQVLKHAGATIPVEARLKRSRDTRPQTTLSKVERLKNVENAFSVVGTIDADTIYMVVDDVVTTGATMRSAMHALQSAGAKDVFGLAFAY